MPDRSLAAVLRAGADALSTPELRRLAGDLDAPLRVAVTGHPGAGCDTVRSALRCAGVPEAGPGPHDSRYLFDQFDRLMSGEEI